MCNSNYIAPIVEAFRSKTDDRNYSHHAIIMPAKSISWYVEKISYGTNTLEKFRGMPSKHAEMDAITKIRFKKNLPKSMDIVVLRISKNGILGESRPCYHCLHMIEQSNLNIRCIYYSNRNGTIQKEKFKNMKKSELTYISSGFRRKINI